MKIDNMYKIEEAASEDTRREAINSVHVAKVDGSAKAVATDGRIMALVPVELEEGDSENVSVRPDAFTVARKEAKSRKNLLSLIKLNGSATVKLEDGERSFAYVGLQYPNFAQVLPKPAEKTVQVALDIKLLTRLWKALGGEAGKEAGVILTVALGADGKADTFRPVEVKTRCGGGYGIIMQMRTE